NNRRWLYAASGAALGLAAIVRAFYLYPALVCSGVLAALALSRRVGWDRFACLAAACLLPIVLQYTVTYSRTGSWSFIDPARVEGGKVEQFQNAWSGYDTVFEVKGLAKYYSAADCFPGSDVMSDAIEKHDVRALGCLLLRRQQFYLGSFVPDGATYLSKAEER